MNKKYVSILLAVFFILTACGNQGAVTSKDSKTEGNASEEVASNEAKDSGNENKTQTITYLGKEYTVPAKVEKIVAASQEAMEDAAILGVKPVGAIAAAGKFPEYLGDSMSEAIEIGDKKQPNSEVLLQLKPDVILGTSKFQPEVVKNLNSVAPMIPISHISTNWKDNLLVLAELSGKKEEAEQIIKQYEADAAEVKKQLASSMKDKKVLMVRIRGGNIFIYSQDVYFNPVLYSDLGLTVPKEILASQSQEMITLEKLAEINPDYLFVQFEESENAQTPEALKDLQNNTIWKSIQAVKSDKVFINTVSPLAAGGTALSKTEFLKVVKEKLVE
ncbi:ABC transporter substrate-binding protein [Neobacillus sp.]|uniref:ABC transporter substrate-binding protein n=1 Tax=Neobacillus sp. TaxID=2675273 RepID=UPI0035B5515A